jgi:dTDP-4-amino-4,6-dideoxyglucose formyltransferase
VKKILVVIDNILLYERLKTIFLTKGRADLQTTFKHSSIGSAISYHPDFIGGSGLIDVKKEAKEILENYQLVLSVHCLQFFPKELVKNVRCINVHPGYNPINRGWYPQVFAIIHDLPIGATIHEMDEKLDNGPIVARELVEKHDWDTSLSIYDRVLETEMKLFEQYFDAIMDETYTPIHPESNGNMFRKSDFNALCEIDMEEEGTFRAFYDKLRALTHGDYKNAFFIDKNGQKIYMKLDLEKKN